MFLQGITVKIDELGDLVIARIMSGSMIDKQGLLHVGDIIQEINGIPVASPEQMMDIIKYTEGSITLKIVPTVQEQHLKSQVCLGTGQYLLGGWDRCILNFKCEKSLYPILRENKQKLLSYHC